MSRIKKTLPIALLLFTLSAAAAAQGSYTAGSCNYSDVNAVINGPTHVAVDGDTINIPAGTCTWSSQLVVKVGISIIGAGVSSTTITDNATSTMLVWNIPSATSSVSRISGMTIAPGTFSSTPPQPTIANITGTCNSSTCSNIRWDHLTFPNFAYWNGSTGSFQGFMLYVNDVFGVMDNLNVSFTTGGEFVDIGHGSYGGLGSNGDNSWAQPDSYGTVNALYVEDSSFSDTATAGMAVTDSDEGGGARFVGRFNTLTNASFQTHGTESTGRMRGSRQVEAYNNSTLCSGCNGGVVVGLRSGSALVFNNSLSISNGGWFNYEVSPTLYRTEAAFTPWGTCDGSGPYDQNDGTVYASGTATGSQSFIDSTKNWTTNQWASSGGYPYSLHNTSGTGNSGMSGWGEEISSNTSDAITPLGQAQCNWGAGTACTWTNGNNYEILRARACIDQPGRGGNGATYLSGTTPTPTGWVNEPLDPVYEWGSTESGGHPNFGWVYPLSTQRLIANRDYYSQNSSFNGTSGTGTGLLANRPSTCTTGVAYWAEDQGNWNQSSSGGQGQLYVCTATNTWNLYYTPYTYPHPLTGGVTTSDPPNPPSGLQAVVQ